VPSNRFQLDGWVSREPEEYENKKDPDKPWIRFDIRAEEWGKARFDKARAWFTIMGQWWVLRKAKKEKLTVGDLVHLQGKLQSKHHERECSKCGHVMTTRTITLWVDDLNVKRQGSRHEGKHFDDETQTEADPPI
jgi:hypothetical protein